MVKNKILNIAQFIYLLKINTYYVALYYDR